MDNYGKLPDKKVTSLGIVSQKFIEIGVSSFLDACLYIHNLPYGYNHDYDDILIVFRENQGSCTMKHAVIATLAEELGILLFKNIGIYKFTEDITTGAQKIMDKYQIPYIPMIHCFLVYQNLRFDLTEGNINGKKKSIEKFIHTTKVIPNISRNDEYKIFRSILKEKILPSKEMNQVSPIEVLKAREEAIKLLKNSI